MTGKSMFPLASIPRRAKAVVPRPKPGPSFFLIEELGAPARVIGLDMRLAVCLRQLSAAGAAGLLGADPRLSLRIRELRAAGVPIITGRVPKANGGAGHIACYSLAADVSRVDATAPTITASPRA